jgi:hypothetical protein
MAPEVVDVVSSGIDMVTLTFSEPIEPGAWTVLTHTESGESLCLGYLPGDVNGDGSSKAGDIVALIDSVNAAGTEQLPIYSTDIDRNGVVTARDILRLIDLLNGAGAIRSWMGETLPPSPCAGP